MSATNNNRAGELLDAILATAHAMPGQSPQTRLQTYEAIKKMMDELRTIIDGQTRSAPRIVILDLIGSAMRVLALQGSSEKFERECLEMIANAVASLRDHPSLRDSRTS